MWCPVELSGAKRIDRSCSGVKPHSRIKEIEVKHGQKCIEEGVQDSSRFAHAPNGWKSKNAD
jgi:hypothetical protein